jgi:hypothetical protein
MGIALIAHRPRVPEPGSTAFFTIGCSDGTLIEEEFVYPTLNPCEAIGSWVKLELLSDNRVGARRFQLIEAMRASNAVATIAESARKKRRERGEIERQAILRPLLAVARQRRQASRGGGAIFYEWEIERLEKMSLKALKKLQAAQGEAETDAEADQAT